MGIAEFLWRGVDVLLRNVTKYHIDMDVKEEDGFSWHLTGVYGHPRTDQKYKTWQDMRDMMVNLVKPWLCAGNFNEVLVAHEKVGVIPKS